MVNEKSDSLISIEKVQLEIDIVFSFFYSNPGFSPYKFDMKEVV